MQADDDKMCMMRGCTQHDLLASKCRDCGKTFCSDHITRQQHACARTLTPPPQQQQQQTGGSASSWVACPVCTQHVTIPVGKSADAVIAAHIDAGCPVVRDATITARTSSASEPKLLNFCDFQSCRRNEASLILCPQCRGSFCVDHRHTDAHDCRVAKRMPPVGKANTPSDAARLQSNASSGPRNIGSVAKPLSLVPGKLSTVASDQEGISVTVTVPATFTLDRRQSVVHMLVVPSTTVGRLLDAVCDHADVRNPNNVSSTRPENRICLFAGATPLPPATTLATMSQYRSGGGAMILALDHAQQSAATQGSSNSSSTQPTSSSTTTPQRESSAVKDVNAPREGDASSCVVH